MTEPVTYTPPEPNAALVVGPDDVLVLSFPDITREQVDELKAQLSEKHPSLVDRVVFIGGSEQIAVVHPNVAVDAEFDPAKVKVMTAWAPVNITGYDEEGRPLIFHPPCAESHPYIEGEILCPVYRDVQTLLSEAYEKLLDPNVAVEHPTSSGDPSTRPPG